MSIFDTRRNRKRKGMIFLTKMFDKRTDGPYYDDRHKMFSQIDRKFVHSRINDALIEAGTGGFMSEAFDIDENRYIVFACVKKGSKKEEVIKSFGFVEMEVA